ncbi:hypothetical protein PMAYCL1PPCAC_05919 [Pristionchus mayeri]|uniref:Nuclear receptor n=1 Tax=Pristionchus mayeri TaxID=1317129 RepID=A0AAN4Z9B3_9BILA|nr:hypothetical protein PMAYCL1PPCAC_05919 [Pristionchus mayeri]
MAKMAKKRRVERERQECPSTCVGCGAAASGYHYEAPACSACKTFFRRAVMQEREHLGCLKGGVCDRNPSLNPCRACRLERCVRGGMNPLLILTIKNPKANPVVQKYLADDVQPSTSFDCDDSRALVLLSPKRTTTPTEVECTIDGIIGALMHIEKAHDALRGSPFDPDPAKCQLDTVLLGKPMMNMSLEELQRYAYDPQPPRKPWRPGAWKCWPFADLLFSIEYMKTFEFFHQLSNQDQKSLCRHAAIMCSQLTLAFFSYERKSDASIHPDGFMPFKGFVPAEFPHEREWNHVTIQLIRDLELDKKEYVLLKALIICNPAIEGLSTSYKSKLEQERDKYTKSLMSYVMSRRGHEKGPAALMSMMSLVDWLTRLMKRHKNWYALRKALAFEQGTEKPESIVDDILFH